jgi:hypothetical protein
MTTKPVSFAAFEKLQSLSGVASAMAVGVREGEFSMIDDGRYNEF